MTFKKTLETIKQAGLEGGRIVLIAVVSYLATDLVVNGIVEATLGSYLPDAVKFQITALLVVVAKAIDRSLHETKVAEKGLTRF